MAQQNADVILTTAADIQGAQSDVDKLMRSLNGIGKTKPIPVEVDTSKAQKSIRDLLVVENAEKFKGWLGDVRDAFDLAGKELIGLTDKQSKAASEAGYLIEKGIAIGGAFGVGGAIAGAAIGAIGGYLLDIIKTSEEKRKKVIEHFREEEKTIQDVINKLREYKNAFNVEAGTGHYKKTLEELEDFRSKNTQVYKELDDNINNNIAKLREMGQENMIRFDEWINENKEASLLFQHITQMQSEQEALNEAMLQRSQQSTIAAMTDVLELGNNSTKSMAATFEDMDRKERLAKAATKDLEAAVKDGRKSMNDLKESTDKWRGSLTDVSDLVLSGKFDDAAKVIKDAFAWITFNQKEFESTAKTVNENQEELDRRREAAKRKRDQENREILDYAKELNRVVGDARKDANSVNEDKFIHTAQDTKEWIKTTKDEVLQYTVDLADLEQRRGESDEAYIARVKETLGISKDAKAQEIKDALDVTIATIDELDTRLEASKDFAGREEKIESDKIRYLKLLREQDAREREAAAKENLALINLSIEEEKQLLKEHLANKPKFYQNPVSVLEAREAERDAIIEQIELRAELLRQSAKTASEMVKIEQEAARERAEIDRELTDYRKDLLDEYTNKYKEILTPIVDVSTKMAKKVAENMANERRAFEGLPMAIRDQVADILKAKAKLWVGHAIEQGAAAFASLAIGDFRGAALHGIAAVGYGAAAALAGYASTKLDHQNEMSSGANDRRAGNSSLGEGGPQTRELAPVVVYLTGPNGTLVIPSSDPHALADLGDFVTHSINMSQARKGY
jgi:hypothetical protein